MPIVLISVATCNRPTSKPSRVNSACSISAARKRIVEMQLVHRAHQGKVGIWRRMRQIVDATPTDPEQACLPPDRQFVLPVDHFLAPGNRSALPSAPDKNHSPAPADDLRMRRLHIDRRRRSTGLLAAVEHVGGALQQLLGPSRNLVRVIVELLGQLRHRLPTAYHGKRHLCLKIRAVVPAWPSADRCSRSRPSRRSQAKTSLSPVCGLPEPPLFLCNASLCRPLLW